MLAKLRTWLLAETCIASCADSISNWFALPAWARKPGASSGLFMSGGGGGGLVEQAASIIAPPSRIPSFLISALPVFIVPRVKPASRRVVPEVNLHRCQG